MVDTGIHYFGWTRQEAIDYFKDNAAKSEADIINEIDRYIGWPGQALAYKIGQLKMLEPRATAEARLGEEFDIRAFHDELFGAGAIPLDALESRMMDWIDSQGEHAVARQHSGCRIYSGKYKRPFGVAHATTYKFDAVISNRQRKVAAFG